MKNIILSGVSYSGKTYACNHLREKFGLVKPLSTTTRKPREDEQNMIDYHFVNEKLFMLGVNNDLFFEYTGIYDALYGTSHYAKLQAEALAMNANTALIWVADPFNASMVLKDRLSNSITIFFDTGKKRTKKRKKEDKYYRQFSQYFDYVLFNDFKDTYIKELDEIVIKHLKS